MAAFSCELIERTPRPQRVVYLAMHTDYSEEFCPDTTLSEARCGAVAVERLLKGNRGHYGCLEHPQMTLLLQVDHNTAMQLRTHRVGVSFDIQSMRYTGDRMLSCQRGEVPLEDVFWVRPAGTYRDRQGDPYEWDTNDFVEQQAAIRRALDIYARLREKGVAEEHARGILPTCYLQNVCMSGNLRSWLHLMDVRSKADAQLEIRQAMDLIAVQLRRWAPQIFAWYESSRLGRAILAP